MLLCTCTHTEALMHTCAHTHVHMHAHKRMCTHMCTLACTHKIMCTCLSSHYSVPIYVGPVILPACICSLPYAHPFSQLHSAASCPEPTLPIQDSLPAVTLFCSLFTLDTITQKLCRPSACGAELGQRGSKPTCCFSEGTAGSG